MKNTILIDSERSYLSVSHLVRSEENPTGTVIRVRADSYERLTLAVDKLTHRCLPQWTGGPPMTDEDFNNLEIVAWDTLTHSADSARRNLIAPTGDVRTLWARKDSLTPRRQDWGTMSDMIIRVIEPLAVFCEDEGFRLLILTQESNREEEATEVMKKGPDSNPALLKPILRNSDYIWRIWREEAQIRVRGTLYPANTHFLRLTTSEQKMTKTRLPTQYSRELEPEVPNPTLQKVWEILGPFKPILFTVFGPHGSGKTTFACSLSEPENYLQTNAQAIGLK